MREDSRYFYWESGGNWREINEYIQRKVEQGYKVHSFSRVPLVVAILFERVSS